MQNKEKILKLRYDISKTVLFSILIILFSASIAQPQSKGSIKFALSVIIVLSIMAVIIYFIKWLKSIKELKKFYSK